MDTFLRVENGETIHAEIGQFIGRIFHQSAGVDISGRKVQCGLPNSPSDKPCLSDRVLGAAPGYNDPVLKETATGLTKISCHRKNKERQRCSP